jgi:hypothetical protein
MEIARVRGWDDKAAAKNIDKSIKAAASCSSISLSLFQPAGYSGGRGRGMRAP